MFKYTSFLLSYFFLLCLVTLTSCQQEAVIVSDLFRPNNHHEAYQYQLEQTGIDQTALGKAWIQAAESALTEPLIIETPFSEEFYQDSKQVKSVGYRLSALRGHKITVELESQLQNETKLFLQIFRVTNDTLNLYEHIASNNDTLSYLEFEPQADEDYIIRFQTEILRGGRFNIKIKSLPALAFPVSGKDKSAIGSLFGVPRDAGRRKHHGIDIFAKRHTPIIAPCDGFIRSTKENELGGKVIWFRDTERQQTLYFAHLQDVLVSEDAQIEKGDTIATVGNSGNAKTTAPHLHFGIYKNGPIDPYHFVVAPRTKFKKELANQENIGSIARTSNATNLKLNDITRKSGKKKLTDNQILRVVGTSAAYYRVELPDSTVGYIAYSDIESTSKPIKKLNVQSNTNLLAAPNEHTLVINSIDNATSVKVLGMHHNYYYIEDDGRTGWILSEE